MSDDAPKSKIKRSFERAWDEFRERIFAKRLEYVHKGFDAFRKGEISVAVQNYHAYIRVLEEVKQVPEGKLSKQNFDVTKEPQELVLLSGVYWDLLRAYDFTRTEKGQLDFFNYTRRFVEFTVGFPHQPTAAETLRKYIRSRRSPHRKILKQIYREIAPSAAGCFVVTSLEDRTRPRTLAIYRGFRANVLAHSRFGRKFTAWYYRRGPSLALWVDARSPWIRTCLGKALDFGAFMLSLGRCQCVPDETEMPNPAKN